MGERVGKFLRAFPGLCDKISIMKKLGLGVLGLGEGRSIISAGVNSDLWQVAQLCDINAQLDRLHEHKG